MLTFVLIYYILFGLIALAGLRLSWQSLRRAEYGHATGGAFLVSAILAGLSIPVLL